MMECNDILRHDLHEKYLLDRLSGPEKEAYLKHLAGCGNCRGELEKQRMLILGIKAIGREDMKAEIRRQAQEHRSRQTTPDWGLILKAAAVFLILVITPGIIYYYQNIAPSHKLVPRVPSLREKSQATGQARPGGESAMTAERKSAISPSAKEKYQNTTDLMQKNEKEELPENELGRAQADEKTSATVAADAGAASKTVAPLTSPGMPHEKKSAGEQTPASKTSGEMAAPGEIAARAQKSVGKQGFSDKMAQDEAVRLNSPKSSREIKGKGRGVQQNGIYRYQPLATEGALGLHTMGESPAFATRKETTDAKMQSLVFHSGGREVRVRFFPGTELPKAEHDSLPETFPVQIVSQDSAGVHMIWTLPGMLSHIDPDSIWLKIERDKIMSVHFGSEAVYRIDLTGSETSAVRQRP